MTSYAIVLGAGGAAGWGIHFGACDALVDAGLPVAGATHVIGTSAGAAVAASHLGGVDASTALNDVLRPPSAEQRQAYLAEVRERARDRSWWPAAPALVRAALPGGPGLGVAWAGLAPRGLFPGDSLVRFPGLAHDEGWPPGLRIVAVRLDDGERIAFGSADAPTVSVTDAVRASQSVPMLFEPTSLAGHHYVDGAVWSSTHADLLLHEPPDLAVVVAPMARRGRRVGLHLARSRARDELAKLVDAGTEVVAVRPGEDSEELFTSSARTDPDLGHRLVDLGCRMVGEALARHGIV